MVQPTPVGAKHRRQHFSHRAGAWVVTLLTIAGCSDAGVERLDEGMTGFDAGDTPHDTGSAPGDLGGTSSPDAAPEPAPPCTLSVDLESGLLRPRCATSGCHSESDQAAGLDLQSPGVLARLSGAGAVTCPGRVLVVPGRPSQSYLLDKLGPSPACGRTMPLGAAPLSADEVSCLRRWVSLAMGSGPVDAGPADAGPQTPCAASDTDGDGFGTHPSCAPRDCDDRNAAIHPGATEACNGLDDDCNGMVDDGFVTTACGVGACRREAPLCVGGRFQACTPAMPTREVCDGVDNDCNGMVDDGAPGVTCGVGRCQRTVACVGGRLGMCSPGAATTETCNGMDDDCDGETDEGFRAAAVQTTYTELAQRHDGCTATSRIGPTCNAAMSRFCAGRDCATTGFGPLENSGDVAVVGCVRAEVRETRYSVLVQQQEGCTGSGQRMGPECNAAIHRWCRAQGFVSGFGPLENSGDTAVVGCLPAAVGQSIDTTYTELGRSHAGCTRAARWGSDCNAAIHRYCTGRGFATGYGPVENNGDYAAVVCVRR